MERCDNFQISPHDEAAKGVSEKKKSLSLKNIYIKPNHITVA